MQAVTEVWWKGEDGAKLALSVFVDELQKVEPQLLKYACGQWTRKNSKFPRLSQLLAFIADNRPDDANRPAALPSPELAGGVERQEAIDLLCQYLPQRGKTLLGGDMRAYREFVAEAGRIWSKVRPEGGLYEVDQSRGLRRVMGFALEAWARQYLGDVPLHVDYAADGVARMLRDMTGDDLLSHGMPSMPVTQAGPVSPPINRI